MPKRLLIKATRNPVIVIARTALHEDKLVYVACANRAIPYPRGRSRIVYIGTTKNGVSRIAASAARAGKRFLSMHGVKSLSLFVVTCRRRPGARTWRKLERALLLAFKEQFGSVPVGNTQGKNSFWDDESQYFKPARLRAVIIGYSAVEPSARRTSRRRRGSVTKPGRR